MNSFTRLFRALRLTRRRLPAANATDGAPTSLRPGIIAFDDASNAIYLGKSDNSVHTFSGGGGATGPQGATGPAGSVGATGPQGATGVSYTNVVSTPDQITADQNNYALPAGADIIRLAADAARNITGIAAGTEGQSVLLLNVGSFAITLKHQSASSDAANRFIVPWAGDYVLAASGGAALIIYDDTADRWRVV